MTVDNHACPSIRLSVSPKRVSPGQLYFKCKEKRTTKLRKDVKGKGKQQENNLPSTLTQPEDLPSIQSLQDDPLFRRLQGLHESNGDDDDAPNANSKTSKANKVKSVLYDSQGASDVTFDSMQPTEELAWQRTTLVWSKGSSVYRIYSFSEDPEDKETVQQALFAYFEVPAPPPNKGQGHEHTESPVASTSSSPPPLTDDLSSETDDVYGPFHPKTPPPPWSDDNANAMASQTAASVLTSVKKVRVLVVSFAEFIRLYFPSGRQHDIPVPFKLRRVWAMERGLLLEKEAPSKRMVPSFLSSSFGLDSIGDDRASAMWFTLFDPLEDLKPASRTSSITNIPNVRPLAPLAARRKTEIGRKDLNIVDNSKEQILLVADRRDMAEPLIITVNTETGCVSIWAYATREQDPKHTIQAFRKAFREDQEDSFEDLVEMHGHQTNMRDAKKAPNSSTIPHSAIGKRRRSDATSEPAAASSDFDVPMSTAETDTSTRPFGMTNAQRRISALLDRRKSQHNPDATVAELMNGLAPAGAQHIPSTQPGQTRRQRRSTIKDPLVSSAGMDRRTSTTRNELSVSLDRMAIGGSTAIPPSTSGRAFPDPGQLASSDRRERFEALAGHGDMERDTSYVETRAKEADLENGLFVTCLYTLQLQHYLPAHQNSIQAVVYAVGGGDTDIAVHPPAQEQAFLLRVQRSCTGVNSNLYCELLETISTRNVGVIRDTEKLANNLMYLDNDGNIRLASTRLRAFHAHLPAENHSICFSDDSNNLTKTDAKRALALRRVCVPPLPGGGMPVIACLNVLQDVLPAYEYHCLMARYRLACEDLLLDCPPAAYMYALQHALLGATITDVAGIRASTMTKFSWDNRGSLASANAGNTPPSGGPGLPTQFLPLCIYALRLKSEECKLFLTTQRDVQVIAALIGHIASHVGASKYMDAAVRDGWIPMDSHSPSKNVNTIFNLVPPFQVQEHILSCLLSGPPQPPPFDTLHKMYLEVNGGMESFVSPIRSLAALEGVLGVYYKQADTVHNVEHEGKWSTAEQIVLASAKAGLSPELLSDLAIPVALPIREAIRICQAHPRVDWPKAVHALLGRLDQVSSASLDGLERKREPLSVKKRLQHAIDTACDSSRNIRPISYAQHLPKRKHTDKATRFSLDHRLDDVQRMLTYTTQRHVKLPAGVQPSDADMADAHQKHIVALACQTLSLPVGNGMFFYRASSRSRAMGIPIPKVELSARIVPSPTVLQPDSDHLVPEEKVWPYFHSGVATALHVAWGANDFDASEYAFHRPLELNARHGGFLLGLGLTGQLRSLGTYQAFSYMDPKHEYTSVGLLLGLGAAYVGTRDVKVSSALSVHTAALHPPSAAELNVSLELQASALVAIGFVHVSSMNRRIADNVLRDLTKIYTSGVEHPDGAREAYAMAAGYSYGLVMLGRGNEVSGPSEKRILETFKYLSEGSQGTHIPGARKNVEGTLDVSVTSPASAFALGLTFMRTNRLDVAMTLEIPQNIGRLDHVRNDVVLIRSIARHIIMWDRIACTAASVTYMIPDFVMKKVNRKGQLGSTVLSDEELVYWSVIAGGCMAIGLKYAGSAKVEAHSLLMEYLDRIVRKMSSITVTISLRSKLSWNTLQICTSVICLALSAVMAGTGELNVLRRLRVMHGHVKEDISYGTHLAVHMSIGLLFLGKGRYTLGTSKVATAALLGAFYPIFPQRPSANRFHLQALRHFWVLAVESRCLIARDVDTGKPVYLRLKFKLQEASEGGDITTTSKHLTAPTLTPALSSIRAIQTDSPRYWPVTLDLASLKEHRETFIQNQTLYVKRKAGHLSYAQDPRGIRSLYTQPKAEASSAVFDNGRSADALCTQPHHIHGIISCFIAQSNVASTQHLRCFGMSQAEDLSGTRRFSRFTVCCITECLLQDKLDAIGLYRLLFQSEQHARRGETLSTQTLVFVRRFFDESVYTKIFGHRKPSLIRRDYVDHLNGALQHHANELSDELSTMEALRTYIRHFNRPSQAILPSQSFEAMRTVLLVLEAPNIDVLRELCQRAMALRQTLGEQSNQLLPMLIARFLQATEPPQSTMKTQTLAYVLASPILSDVVDPLHSST